VEALRIWQHVKNEALGSSRDSERLDEVLCGAELGMWRRRMRKMVISELSWRYETRRVEVQQVTMLNTMRARSLRVMAAVYERATLCDPSGPLPHHSYQVTCIARPCASLPFRETLVRPNPLFIKLSQHCGISCRPHIEWSSC
jgi:hypothetical protein